MFYLASSEELHCYIIGQTQYSQYFKAETHFKNSVARMGISKEKFNRFEIFSFPGEEESFQEEIKKLDKKGFFPLNRSFKYTQLIYKITGNSEIFGSLDSKIDKLEKKLPPKREKKAFGEYKRVILTNQQYKKLCDEFTEEPVLKVIPYVDEYLESNNNKNGYTNFYILIKRALREDWYNLRMEFQKHKEEQAQGEEETPEFVKDFMNNIK